MSLFGRGFQLKNKKKMEVVLIIRERNVNNMQRSMGLKSLAITEVHMSQQKQLENFVGK